jgi:hypothetical protein
MQPGRYCVTVTRDPKTSYGKKNPITLNVGNSQRLGMSVEEAEDLIEQLTKAVQMAKEGK